MLPFKPTVVESQMDVSRRLEDFGLIPSQFEEIAKVARTWADDSSPLMPINAPGMLAYLYGVGELRQQLLDGEWSVDRTCGIEAVCNRARNIRIGYQNVDRSCDPLFPPNPRSAKGSASEGLCGPTLFEHAGIETGPLTGVRSDGVPTYYVMVGEDGSVELSQPVIKKGVFKSFVERIFISAPNRDWDAEIDPENGPVDDFDISVEFKEGS